MSSGNLVTSNNLTSNPVNFGPFQNIPKTTIPRILSVPFVSKEIAVIINKLSGVSR